ncbi:DUF3109 family protein [bacterium]|jgi:hypothetical protein|nr:DUF3109 family protein [bacterium]
MFFVEDVMIAEGLRVARFACRVSECKGACCVEGEQGGPLSLKEARWIEENIEEFLPKMDPQSRTQVRLKGAVDKSEKGGGGGHTPLLGEGGPCVYLVHDKQGVGHCLFEKSYADGKSSFRKPVSCQLYPLIFKETRFYKVLTYERRGVCLSSWNRGPLLLEFEKEALLRKFGESFTKKLLEEVNTKEKSQ